MSELAFISPGAARPESGFEPRVSSPLARALAGSTGIRDLSGLGKLEVRRADIAALGHYMWTTVADAAASLGGGPVGVDGLVPVTEELAHA